MCSVKVKLYLRLLDTPLIMSGDYFLWFFSQFFLQHFYFYVLGEQPTVVVFLQFVADTHPVCKSKHFV